MYLLEQKRFYLVVLALIFLVSALVRFYRLDQVPAGMSWDEAAIGYNGFAVRTIHRDEWLHFLPISFQSFGDYKAPLAIYVNGISTMVFGLNLWAVRFPFALMGVLSIVGVSVLVDQLLKVFIESSVNTQTIKKTRRLVILLSTAIFAFSPWHVFFTRAGFESGMALGFVIWAVDCYLLSLKSAHIRKLLFTFGSVLFFVCGLYTYHSAKIFVPLLLLLLLFYFRKHITSDRKTTFLSVFFGVLLLLPLAYDTFHGKGATRLSQTSILGSPTLSIPQKISSVTVNYFAHFSLSFLVEGATTTLRHSDGHWGVLYLTELLLVIGTIGWVTYKKFVIKDDSQLYTAVYKFFFFSMLWLLVGIIPAAIGFEVPHGNRALLSYPGFVLVQTIGLFMLVFEIYSRALNTSPRATEHSTGSTLFLQSIFGMGILIQTLLAVTFFHDYFTKYATDSVDAFSYGYEQAFNTVIPIEPSVDKVMFTSSYGEPYIYALFFRKTNPILYHGGSLIKYEFPDKVTVGDLMRKNALIVATPKEIDPSLADTLIIAPNGEVRFVIVQTPKE